MIPANKLGWMAGVVDLKGRVKMLNPPSRNRRPMLSVYVESREMAVIRELCSLTGTRPSVAPEKDAGAWDRKGCSQHCPEPHIHVNTTMPAVGRWHVTGAGAAIVLYNLLPFLLSDRGFTELMDKAISACPKSGQGRHAIDTTINRLEALSWEIPDGLRGDDEEPAQGEAA